MNPMAGVEQLWKDYCNYENGVNPLIAKKLIDDRFGGNRGVNWTNPLQLEL